MVLLISGNLSALQSACTIHGGGTVAVSDLQVDDDLTPSPIIRS